MFSKTFPPLALIDDIAQERTDFLIDSASTGQKKTNLMNYFLVHYRRSQQSESLSNCRHLVSFGVGCAKSARGKHKWDPENGAEATKNSSRRFVKHFTTQ